MKRTWLLLIHTERFFHAELVFAKGQATVCERTWHLVGNSRWATCLTSYNVFVSRTYPRIWECISYGDLISRRYRIFQDTRIDFFAILVSENARECY